MSERRRTPSASLIAGRDDDLIELIDELDQLGRSEKGAKIREALRIGFGLAQADGTLEQVRAEIRQGFAELRRELAYPLTASGESSTVESPGYTPGTWDQFKLGE